MPRLTELLRAIPHDAGDTAALDGLTIRHVTADSRQVTPDTLFVAIPGVKQDGAAFLPQAIEKGAVAALVGIESTLPALPADFPVIRTENIRLALAKIAAAFYGKQPPYVVAVTGTDGKTSTADFFRQLAHLCGHKSASIGTLGVFDGEGRKLAEGVHTTPDPVRLHQLLKELAEQGITHVCMEASSHGLDQYRLDGVKLAAAAFTNLTRDHLDYHGDEESYFRAKARLFEELLPDDGYGVINNDDARAEYLENVCIEKGRYAIFGRTPGTGGEDQRLLIQDLKPLPDGQQASVSFLRERNRKKKGILKFLQPTHQDETIALMLPIVGAFQVYNMLAAVGLMISCGEKVETLLPLLPQLKGVPGRLEHVATLTSGASVYIDYAHTPAALANILKTLRPHTENQLAVVFGCGGDRDAGKRPEMGKAAATYADRVFVTDDNPRSEDPALIRASVMAAAPGAKEVAGRREAIYAALASLHKGDVLVIAGKGHETEQIIGEQKLHFSDAEVVREWVDKERNNVIPQML